MTNYLFDSVGRSGFEPLKSKNSGFTVRPIWPLWNLPSQKLFLSHLSESNQRPTDYKSVALPAELKWQVFNNQQRTTPFFGKAKVKENDN
jgi:hypothetical protein